jgi:tetratricopeptide (TPR) repeat protein
LPAHIARHWPYGTFWFTVRAGLTDRMASLVFAFAFYLRSRGASATWRQLIADSGLIQVDQVLSLLRFDLSMSEDAPLLLCIDDVDTLTAERADHAQLLYLLDELRSHVRLLLLGQRIALETDAHFELKGFDAAELAEWLDYAGIQELDVVQRKNLHQATNGHPALLALLLTLHRYGEDLLATAATLSTVSSLEFLLTRVWRRLEEPERHLLMEIAVFRTPAPADIWLKHSAVLARLVATGLVFSDEYGGVECDQHIRPLIYDRIAPEQRRVLHLRAADTLEEHGDFVRAMYHYIEARQPAQATWLWFRHRTQQIERGHGPAALALLDQIAVADLTDASDREALSLSRAELLKLVGRPEAVADALRGLHLRQGSAAAAYSQQLLADALEIQGDIERSLASYRSALETLMGSVPLRQVVIYQKLSYLHAARLPDLGAAQQEAMQALFHAETFAANVDELRGDLVSARVRYERALEIAGHVQNNIGLLTIAHSHLGKLLLKVGALDAAVDTIHLALQLSEQRGDVIGPLYDRINLAYALAVQGRCADALDIAKEGLLTAERMRHTYLIAGLSAAAADAAYRQHDMEAAELYATRTLLQEEEFFRPWALTMLGLAQAGRDRIPAAMSSLQMAVEAARIQDDIYGDAYALEALGKVCWQAGEQTAAESKLRQALQIYQNNGFSFEAARLRAEMVNFGANPERADDA